MYFVLYVGMARSLRGALLCLTFGVAVQCAWLADRRPVRRTLLHAPAGALFSFALGATLYFALRNDATPANIKLGARPRRRPGRSTSWPRGRSFRTAMPCTAGFYVNTVLAALVVVFLSRLDPGPRLREPRSGARASELPGLPVPVARRLSRLSPLVAERRRAAGDWRWARCRSSSPLPPRSPGRHSVFIEPLRARIRAGEPPLGAAWAAQAPAE